MEVIAEGSEVLLYFSKKYKYLVKVTKQKFSTHRGVVDLSQLIGKPFGSTLETDIGEKFVAAKPTFMDYLERFRKVTQVIYPKDAAAIVLFGCIGPGSRVVEAYYHLGYDAIAINTATLTPLSMPNVLVPNRHTVMTPAIMAIVAVIMFLVFIFPSLHVWFTTHYV